MHWGWRTRCCEGDGKLKLEELAVCYRESARLLEERIRQLKEERNRTDDTLERSCLDGRIEMLTTMFRETRDVAVVCERYYERGYCRNAKYKV